jgi:hypothetical protein
MIAKHYIIPLINNTIVFTTLKSDGSTEKICEQRYLFSRRQEDEISEAGIGIVPINLARRIEN